MSGYEYAERPTPPANRRKIWPHHWNAHWNSNVGRALEDDVSRSRPTKSEYDANFCHEKTLGSGGGRSEPILPQGVERVPIPGRRPCPLRNQPGHLHEHAFQLKQRRTGRRMVQEPYGTDVANSKVLPRSTGRSAPVSSTVTKSASTPSRLVGTRHGSSTVPLSTSQTIPEVKDPPEGRPQSPGCGRRVFAQKYVSSAGDWMSPLNGKTTPTPCGTSNRRSASAHASRDLGMPNPIERQHPIIAPGRSTPCERKNSGTVPSVKRSQSAPAIKRSQSPSCGIRSFPEKYKSSVF